MSTIEYDSDEPTAPAAELLRRTARKVPQLTVYFWIVKILTTAMGEATSDYMVFHMDPVLAVLLGAAAFVVAIALQLLVRRYMAPVYWGAVVMVAVFGTMAADVTHVVLHVPYAISTTFFAICLATVFTLWYRTEGTLSIHSIDTLRREIFYWATVMATFALGTAAGDMTATTLHLGYFASAILFTVLIAMPAVAYFRFGLAEIPAFWTAYVLTRPLGASFADWAGVPRSMGGLDYGRGAVSAVLTVAIVVLVAYLTVTRKDIVDRHA